MLSHFFPSSFFLTMRRERERRAMWLWKEHLDETCPKPPISFLVFRYMGENSLKGIIAGGCVILNVTSPTINANSI